MAATVSGIHLGPDTHANRPAASAPPVGSFYYCSDHDLVYQTDGSSWSTWLDNTASGGDVTTDDAWAAKGDLMAGTGEDTAGIVTVGANGSSPIADSGETAGIRWIKNNIGATAAPDADDDVDEGYEPGSRWVDTTNDKEYVCLDATDGTAVWTETTGTGGGGGSVTVHERDGTPSVTATAIEFPDAGDGAGGIVIDKGSGEAAIMVGEIGRTVYAPGTQATLSTTSTSFVDMDATNLKVDFIAPQSGVVKVILHGLANAAATNDYYQWNLRDSGGDVSGCTPFTVSRTSLPINITGHFYVTGLTAGTSYEWKWGHRVNTGTGRIQAGDSAAANEAGPAIMIVEAVPA